MTKTTIEYNVFWIRNNDERMSSYSRLKDAKKRAYILKTEFNSSKKEHPVTDIRVIKRTIKTRELKV